MPCHCFICHARRCQNHAAPYFSVLCRVIIIPCCVRNLIYKDYLEKYGIDWYKEIKPDPTAIVFPYNENDLQEIVLFAEKEDQKLVISGGRTGLCGGATAARRTPWAGLAVIPVTVIALVRR